MKHEFRNALPRLQSVGSIEPAVMRQLTEWREANAVVLFASARSEPDVWPLFPLAVGAGKTALATRVEDDRLVLVPVTPTTPWRRGDLKVPEPVGDAVDALPSPLLIVVPGVAFTPDGRRLGRGGGYYDRLLAAHPDAFRLGVVADERVVDDLPTEPHDERVDVVVTPTRVIRPPVPRTFGDGGRSW